MYLFQNKINLLIAINLFLLPLAFLWNIDLIPFTMEEPRRVLVALEMNYSGNYIVPKLFGHTYLNKPPIFNWLIIGAQLFFENYSPAVARVVTILSVFLLGLMNYLFIKKMVGKEWATISSFIVITSAHFLFVIGLLGEIDVFYTLLTYLQIICIYFVFNNNKILLPLILSYIFCALGLLTKGLPSIAFQGVTIITFIIYYKKYQLLYDWRNYLGLTLFLGIVILYFYSYNRYEDVSPFLINLFNESSSRLSEEKGSNYTHLLQYPLMLLQIGLPWTIILFALVKKSIRQYLFSHHIVLFSLLFIGANSLIYWVAPQTRPRYLLIFLPFMSYILIYLLKWLAENKIVSPTYISKKGILIVVVILLSARIIFNLTVLPYRAKSHPNNAHIKIAQNMVHHSKNEPIHLHGGVYQVEHKWNLPLLNQLPSGYQYKIPLFHYNLSLYYHQLSGELLLYDENKFVNNHLYLLPTANITLNKKHYCKLYSFFEPSFKIDYSLIRFKK